MTFQDSYREYAPVAALRDHVGCYWISCSPAPASPRTHRILPDGCIDIIFDVSPGQCPQGRMVGTMTRPLIVRPSGQVELVAVRFRPGGATPFLRLDASEITDLQVDLAEAWRTDGLAERLADEPTAQGKIQHLERALLMRLPHASPVNPRVRAAVAIIQQQPQEIGVLARKIGLSRQYLTRLFHCHVGVGPKVLARVERMQSAMSLARAARRPNWARIALQAGYFDQSHMINECRGLAGLSPGELLHV